MNIDLKCFTEEGYRRLGGHLETVKASIGMAAASCHVEVTTLVVPGISDSEAEMDALASWLASIDEEIALHVGRYTPRHKYTQPATDVAAVYKLADIARRHLRYVYTGNC
jgi:pyruvate formate lyase activating enzyme